MRPPRAVQAVVFDMDGLLVDTERLYRDAMIGEASVHGRPMPLATFLQMVGLPSTESDRVALAHFGDAATTARWRDGSLARVDAGLKAGVALKAGAVELLDFLKTERIPRAICTSSSHEVIQAHLGPSGIVPRFQAVIAHGDYARGKPWPDPYLTAAAALGVAPQDCLALEDSHNGVRAAAAAGLMTVMVPDLLDATDEMRSLCIAIHPSLHTVRDTLILSRGPEVRL